MKNKDRDEKGLFVKGHTSGRPKGTTNKIPKQVREGFELLLQNNQNNMQLWLETGAKKKPLEALKILTELAKFVIPTLGKVSQEIDLIQHDSGINFEDLKTEDAKIIFDILQKQNDNK